MTRIFFLILTTVFLSTRAQPERVWEVQHLSETQERIPGSPTFPNSKPLKIRLVNYEQRQLVMRQQGKGHLDSLRQKARGARNHPTQSVIPLVEKTPDKLNPNRLPEVDSLHQARNLFDSRRPDGSSLSPLSELEIKSDRQLQKSMQRTTVKTRIYPTEAIDGDAGDLDLFGPTTPIPQTSTTQQIVVTVTPTTAPQIPVQRPQFTLAPFVGFTTENPTQPNFNLGLGFPPQPPPVALPSPPQPSPVPLPSPSPANLTTTIQFEQLGCGFDLLTNTCKDVFGLGWCQGCEDFGNVFLHDCRCTKPAPRNTSTLDPTGVQQVIQQPTVQQPNLNTTPAGILQNFFVQPTFFGF